MTGVSLAAVPRALAGLTRAIKAVAKENGTVEASDLFEAARRYRWPEAKLATLLSAHTATEMRAQAAPTGDAMKTFLHDAASKLWAADNSPRDGVVTDAELKKIRAKTPGLIASLVTGKSKPAESASVKTMLRDFNRAYYSDDVGYDAVTSEPEVPKAQLPKGSDAAKAFEIFTDWADGTYVNRVTQDGQPLLVISWMADEAGGIEVFNAAGQRLASQGWGDGGPDKAWDVGRDSRYYDEAYQDLHNG